MRHHITNHPSEATFTSIAEVYIATQAGYQRSKEEWGVMYDMYPNDFEREKALYLSTYSRWVDGDPHLEMLYINMLHNRYIPKALCNFMAGYHYLLALCGRDVLPKVLDYLLKWHSADTLTKILLSKYGKSCLLIA